MKKYVSIVALAALLAACGGSGSSYGGSSGVTGNGSGSTALYADSFTDTVARQVAIMSEDGSPIATDGYSATSPEDTLPGQVK